MIEVPPELEQEREALIAEIHAAFAGVSREGGISWSETDVIDSFGSAEECRKARATDTDRSWTELLANERWQADAAAAFCFLDAIGFRYYLPAAMIRNLEQGDRYNTSSHLTLNKATKPGGFRLQEHTLEEWSLLDERQRRCVARFIRFMIASEESDMIDERDGWRAAYARHWKLYG